MKQTLIHPTINFVREQLKPCVVISIGMFIPFQIQAAPPIAFGSTACPSGFTCETNVASTGMSQRILTNSTGTTYFQVTVKEGSGFFYDSFVDGSNNGTKGGISARLNILESGAENLNYSTTLNLGWANSSANPAVDISQAITDTYQGVGFTYNFNYKQKQDNQGNATGFFYDIYERVTGSSSLNGSGSGGNSDIHTFALRRAAGTYVSRGSISLPGSNDGAMGDGGGGGGGGGGGMRKASYGSSTGTTTTLQSAFVADPTGYGTDGTTTTDGDPQTMPADGTTFGPDSNTPPSFVDAFSGSGLNNTNSTTNNDSSTINRVATMTENIGLSNGNIDSFGNARGPAAPTSAVNVASGDTMMMGGMGGGGPAGGTVSWNTGDEVQAIWIGAVCSSCAVGMGGGGMGGTSSAGAFSFHQYENLSTGAKAATRTITGSSPFAWTTSPFGAQPQL